MTAKAGVVCAVNGCLNYAIQKEKKSFFRMPKDSDLLKKWLLACNRQDLLKMMETKETVYFYRTFSVCSDHFELNCFRNQNLYSQGLEKWLAACNRKDLERLLEKKDTVYFRKTYSVCSDHFDVTCFRNKNLLSQGLLPGSIPTLYLLEDQDPLELPNGNNEMRPQENFTDKEVPLDVPQIYIKNEVFCEPSTSKVNSVGVQTDKCNLSASEHKLRLENKRLKLKLQRKTVELHTKNGQIDEYRKQICALKVELSRCQK